MSDNADGCAVAHALLLKVVPSGEISAATLHEQRMEYRSRPNGFVEAPSELRVGTVRTTARRIVARMGAFAGDRGETLKMYDSLGYLPNLVWPRSFSEKLVRRKLRTPPAEWSALSDKVDVRKHVAARIGDEFLNPVYQVTTTPEAIDFAQLPDRFVVKASHGSGWNLIVSNRQEISDEQIRARCRPWLAMRYGVDTNESWYACIEPRILIEHFMSDTTHGVPLDFKFWVFHGVVQFVQIDFGRFSAHTRTMYDRQWRRQPWVVGYPPGPDLPRPRLLSEMIEIAERLAFDPEFVRVDLYSPDDESIVFGEVTFAPGAGWERFWPGNRADYYVGSYW
jgi:hypothetical protein